MNVFVQCLPSCDLRSIENTSSGLDRMPISYNQVDSRFSVLSAHFVSLPQFPINVTYLSIQQFSHPLACLLLELEPGAGT